MGRDGAKTGKLVKNTTIAARFNSSEAEAVNIMCEQYGLSQSEIMRCAVKYLYKHMDGFDGLYNHI